MSDTTHTRQTARGFLREHEPGWRHERVQHGVRDATQRADPYSPSTSSTWQCEGLELCSPSPARLVFCVVRSSPLSGESDCDRCSREPFADILEQGGVTLHIGLPPGVHRGDGFDRIPVSGSPTSCAGEGLELCSPSPGTPVFFAAFASLPPPVSPAARFLSMADHLFADNLLQGEAVDRPGPLPERFLSLDNMKWVFDNKIAPRTGVFGREVFLCSGCTDTRPKWLAFARASASHTSDEQRPV